MPPDRLDYADSDDVLADSQPPRRGRPDLDEAHRLEIFRDDHRRAYGQSLYFFLHHHWVSAVTWVGCFALTVWVFGLLPKTFIPSGDSGFIRGVILCQQGISPDRIKVLQKEVDAILRKNPAVDETFTLAGFSQGSLYLYMESLQKSLNDVYAKSAQNPNTTTNRIGLRRVDRPRSIFASPEDSGGPSFRDECYICKKLTSELRK